MSTRQKLQNQAYTPKQWEEVACPVCGFLPFKIWEKFGDKLQYTYVLCKKCKLVYLNPRPLYDDDFVYDAYEFYAEADQRYNITENYYQNQTDFEKRDCDNTSAYDLKRTHVLDVGCATGKFIYRAKAVYKKVSGLEVSKRMAHMVSTALDVEVFTDKFENFNTNEKFSCINMSHVIEHYPFPQKWLRKAKELLEEDGIVVISVPNMFSLDRLIKRIVKKAGLFKNTWEAWRTPDHLFEPTIPAMKFLFASENLTIVDYYSYSRKSAHKKSFFAKLFHKKWRLGSNLKFVVELLR